MLKNSRVNTTAITINAQRNVIVFFFFFVFFGQQAKFHLHHFAQESMKLTGAYIQLYICMYTYITIQNNYKIIKKKNKEYPVMSTSQGTYF